MKTQLFQTTCLWALQATLPILLMKPRDLPTDMAPVRDRQAPLIKTEDKKFLFVLFL